MALLQKVVFALNSEVYGLDIMKVNGIERYQEVLKTPNTPDYLEGIINLRGEVLPVYNLRKKFHLEPKSADVETKIIVVNINDMKIGIVVDSVDEILRIDKESIEETPKIIMGISRKYIENVAILEDRMIMLLDIDLLISDEEKIEMGQLND